jgi:hypothetical protein
MNDIDPLHPTLQCQRNLHEIYAVFMVKLSVIELILLTTIVVFIGNLSCIWLGVPLDALLGGCSFIFNVKVYYGYETMSPF